MDVVSNRADIGYAPDISARNILDRLGISEYLNRPGVTDVMINRPGEVFIDKPDGVSCEHNPHLDYKSLWELANVLTIFNQKHISLAQPMHSVMLPDGERGHILIPPACEEHTVVYGFRKPSKDRFSLGDYIDSGRLAGFRDMSETALEALNVLEGIYTGKQYRDVADELRLPYDVRLDDFELDMMHYKANRDFANFFRLAVEHKLNICMVGGTGSGKTTFSKAIADLIPKETRIATLEDSHELELPNHPNHVHLFIKEHVSAQSLIAACMRIKPDRIFLTELRGGEAWDYLTALNTGHPGGLTSVHSNDSRSVFHRIADLAKQSPTGAGMDYQYLLANAKKTIDIVCFFKDTYMTELYYDPVQKRTAMRS
ncbi:Type II/IV secretion system protein (plasmid) [Advenella kashmirensis WT001]|uniref:Type II/IV secretion system protein n=2 Tax=Advenella TaxID=290425 RepID=I3UHZ2_ADVKW|nr:ATPase, T2SS/T4P/T4SS family [Advenella kashmirensis]ACD43637.1 TagB11 [Advenella kashmirensis]AFK64630.1 Type II/IV secretion system protein [Advenella kashmirensis WT001]